MIEPIEGNKGVAGRNVGRQGRRETVHPQQTINAHRWKKQEKDEMNEWQYYMGHRPCGQSELTNGESVAGERRAESCICLLKQARVNEPADEIMIGHRW